MMSCLVSTFLSNSILPLQHRLMKWVNPKGGYVENINFILSHFLRISWSANELFCRFPLMVWFGLVLWHFNYYRIFNAKSFLYIFIEYIWFGLVLWDINHCKLFKSKSSLYIYIRYIAFGLVGFYDISTIAGYLMPNSFYTYYIWWVNS